MAWLVPSSPNPLVYTVLTQPDSRGGGGPSLELFPNSFPFTLQKKHYCTAKCNICTVLFFFLPTNNVHLSWSWKIPSVWLTFFTAHLLSRPHSEPDSRTPSVHLPGYLKILKNFMVRFILSPICPQWERHPNVDKVSVAKCCVSQVWRSLITKCTCVFYASA